MREETPRDAQDARDPAAAWLARLHARAWQPPLRPRVPLACEWGPIGSVEPALLANYYRIRPYLAKGAELPIGSEPPSRYLLAGQSPK